MPTNPDDPDQSWSQSLRPPPYPLDEILETAYAPTIPHTPDQWEEEEREAKIRATEPQHSTEESPAQHRGAQHSIQPQDRESDTATGPATGASQETEGVSGYGKAEGVSALLVAPPPASYGNGVKTPSFASQVVDNQPYYGKHVKSHDSFDPPETVLQSLQPLPIWQRRYVLALMRLGGVCGLACVEADVSRDTVERALKKSAAFASACAAAVAHSTDLVLAACYRGATIGDLEPIWQGQVLVGYKRRRSTKDAEIVLRVRGILQSTGRASERVTGVPNVATVPVEQVGSIVGNVLRALTAGHRGRPAPVDAEEV